MNYYVIRKTCPTIRKSTYYGVSWPVGQLRQDPMGLKPMYEPNTQPLTQSMILLFAKRDMADLFVRMILVHYVLTGEMPSREIRHDLQHNAWVWTKDSMMSITQHDVEREGFEVEEIPMDRIAQMGISAGILFAEIEFPDGYTFSQPPQRYGVQQVILPLVSHQVAIWRKHLNRSWMDRLPPNV